MDWTAFTLFAETCRPSLQKIARSAGDEYPLDAVVNEAVELANELSEKPDGLDLSDPSVQSKFIAFLHNRLVKWNDQKFRYSARFEDQEGDRSPSEHWALGDEDKVNPHRNDIGRDPIDILLAAEQYKGEPPDPSPHASLAAAYAALLWRFDNRMTLLADHLLISLSWCYACVGRAHRLAESQTPIPTKAVRAADDAPLASWRRFRLQRTPVQLELDFGECGLFSSA